MSALTDLLCVASLLLFFLACAGFTRFCEKLK
jgi:hypothetical protein